MKKRLILTVGLPRSGKSTWARGYANLNNTPIVNPDSIRLAMHGKPFIGSMEPYVWAIARTMVSSLFIAGHDEVILDATNITAERRLQWRSRQWLREFQCFHEDAETCRSRAHTSIDDPFQLEGILGTIDRMAEELEPVADEERRDEVWHREMEDAVRKK